MIDTLTQLLTAVVALFVTTTAVTLSLASVFAPDRTDRDRAWAVLSTLFGRNKR